MKLFIDQENVLSLISFKDDKLFPDCIKTMRKLLDVVFQFDKKTAASSEEISALFKLFGEGVGEKNKHTFDPDKFPIRPLTKKTIDEFQRGHLSACYLLADEGLDNLRSHGAVMIGGVGEELSVFNILFLLNKDYKFERKLKIGGTEFTNWAQISTYSCSTTDIIFIDPYILENVRDIDINLVPYLEALASKAKCQLNFVFYTDKSKTSITYDELQKKIVPAIKKITGVTPKITIATYSNQKGIESFAEHDRTIFTNYYRVYSGDTFNYFDSDGKKVTKGREVHYAGFADPDNYQLASELIKDLQLNITKLPSESISGDKVSNFLLFK